MKLSLDIIALKAQTVRERKHVAVHNSLFPDSSLVVDILCHGVCNKVAREIAHCSLPYVNLKAQAPVVVACLVVFSLCCISLIINGASVFLGYLTALAPEIRPGIFKTIER